MNETDSSAIERTLAGDSDAYRTLVERYSHAVFRLAWRITGSEADADDVVQDAFLKAYRHLASFDQRASFSTWLYRIAANTALDLLKERKRRAAGLDGETTPEARATAPDPERLARSGQVREALHRALNVLTPQERTAFTMRHYEDCPVSEIADVLEVAPAAARHSIFRAVQKLRRALAPLVECEP
jgi:RNA polymerase sigma-70 factor (ECF subfamily)